MCGLYHWTYCSFSICAHKPWPICAGWVSFKPVTKKQEPVSWSIQLGWINTANWIPLTQGPAEVSNSHCCHWTALTGILAQSQTNSWLLQNNMIAFLHFLKFIVNWKIIAVQCCTGFCYTITWISHKYMYVPSPLELPSQAHHFFELECSCFTMSYSFLLYNKVKQLYIYTHIPPPSPNPPVYATTDNQVELLCFIASSHYLFHTW